VIQPKIFQTLLASPAAPITVTIDKKESYDSDDMKVHSEGREAPRHRQDPAARAHRRRIHRHAAVPRRGPKLFTHYLDDIMHTPEGLKWWYLRAIGQIAERANVTTCNIEGMAGARWISRRPRARDQAGRGLGVGRGPSISCRWRQRAHPTGEANACVERG
jgi:hypothetical protein